MMDIQGVISIHHIRDDVGKNRKNRLRRRTHKMDAIELL